MQQYECKHFSLTLPASSDRSNISELLIHLAKTLNDLGIKQVNDIVFHEEDEEGKRIPYVTVYY